MLKMVSIAPAKQPCTMYLFNLTEKRIRAAHAHLCLPRATRLVALPHEGGMTHE